MILLEAYRALEKPYTSKYGSIVQNIIFINILINIISAFSSEVFKLSPDIVKIFNLIEYITVFIFVFELFIRYLVIGHDDKYKGIKGKLAFTFTPYIVIDLISLLPYFLSGIHTDILLARLVRFLRFFRVLKLIRVKDTVKNFYSISAFATSSILVQFIVLFLFSIFFISIFSLIYTEDKTSLLIFLDPSSLSKTETNIEMSLGVVELILGLLVGGALISIITELLDNISNDIKKGFYPYKDSEHIVIINNNDKLEFILSEINYYYCDLEEVQDIVLFLPFVEDIENFSQNIKKYSNLKITFITGAELNWNSYKKVNINEAKKVLILESNSSNIKYLNVKISKFIVSHDKFTNNNLEFIIEAERFPNITTVYSEVFAHKKNPHSIIEHQNIIQKVLNRSIIEPDYFKIFSDLLSYENYEFFNMKASMIIDKNITFKELYMQYDEGILTGLIKNNKIVLNPNNETIVDIEDELIVLLRNKFDYSLTYKENKQSNKIEVKTPKLKVSRKVCIIGDYEDIKNEQIIDFLDDDSIQQIRNITLKNDSEYMQDSFWEEIINSNYNTIILNMEDDYELILTMHLRNKYKDNKRFLDSIINIIHNPTIAKMLFNSESKNNIILSERLVGKYITQVTFNKKVIQIFDELTQSRGNEFYILDKNKYQKLFEMTYEDFKLNLIENNMIYIGSINDGEFSVNNKNLSEVNKVIVLTQGIVT